MRKFTLITIPLTLALLCAGCLTTQTGLHESDYSRESEKNQQHEIYTAVMHAHYLSFSGSVNES